MGRFQDSQINYMQSDVMRDLKEIDKKIDKAESQEEYVHQKMNKLMRGLDLYGGVGRRPVEGYYPY